MVFRQFNCTESHSQGIVGEESSCEEVSFADDVFDCFHCLEASDDSAHGSVYRFGLHPSAADL